jgi:hypothetical protein
MANQPMPDPYTEAEQFHRVVAAARNLLAMKPTTGSVHATGQRLQLAIADLTNETVKQRGRAA